MSNEEKPSTAKSLKTSYCNIGLITMQEEILDALQKTLVRIASKTDPKSSKSWLRVKKRAVLSELEIATKDNKAILASGKIKDDVVQKYIADKTFTKIREISCELIAEIDEQLGEEIEQTTNSSETKVHSDLSLPRLDLPKFSGKYEEWLPFNNLFKASVGNNTSLDPVQKLHYLMKTVTDDAYNTIKNLSLTASNYEKALELLEEQFHHVRKIAHTYMRKLLDGKPIMHENSKDLKTFINIVKDCLISLKDIGLPVDEWGYILLFILQTKIPQVTNAKWEEQLGSSRDIPKFESFLEFLEKRYRTLEMLESPEKEPKRNQKVLHTKSNSRNFGNSHDKSKSKTVREDRNKKISSVKCPLCNENHIISRCKQFLNNTPTQRMNLAIEYKLCLNCLGTSHTIEVCYSLKTCIYCKDQHHSLLHVHNHMSNTVTAHFTTVQNSKSIPQSTNIQQGKAFYVSTKQTVRVLGTALVRLINSSGFATTVRILLDSGAEENYITFSTVNNCGLKKYNAPSSITGLNDILVGTVNYKVNFKLQSIDGNFEYETCASVVDTITSKMPSSYIEPECFGFLNNFKLADPNFNIPGKINLLLGIGFIVKIRQAGFRKFEDFMAEETRLGWVIMGQSPEISNPSSQSSSIFLTKCVSNESLSNQIQKFFEVEEASEIVPEKPENLLCEQRFLNSIKRCPDGKLSVLLPFKEDEPVIGPSKHIAMRRFLTLEKKLEQNPSLKKDYHQTITDYMKNGHLIPITDYCENGQEYFLPHHAVVKNCSSTTKVRVVFDGSCKSADGTSLNDHLLTGPKLQNDIRNVLLNWRKYQYALTADIAKMYMMFWVDKRHHHYQKILWRFNHDEDIREYALTTVTFGTSSAPFQAIRCLNFIAEQEQLKFPLASKSILTEFYVDDLISGGHSLEEAITKQTELREILSQYGLNIRKWSSSHDEALCGILDDQRETSAKFTFEEEEFRKTLGIYWAPKGDYFSFSTEKFSFTNGMFTKRSILSLIARLYDPVGWVSPCTLRAKIIMQRIWEQNLGWDDEVCGSIKTDFQTFLTDLSALSNIKIPRWIQTIDESSPVTLYGFSDASLAGYGAVLYMLNPNPQESNKLILLSSRTRVKPLKHISLARMELCAAVMLSELIKWVTDLFKPRLVTALAFSDSKIVLSWLAAHPSKWRMYVASRTSKILENMTAKQWSYINTKLNPADFASRGLLPSELINNSLWWNGPPLEYLNNNNTNELTEEDKTTILTEIKEKSTVLHSKSSLHYSSHEKMIRVMNYVLTFIKNILTKSKSKYFEKNNSISTIIDICSRPEIQIFRQVQLHHYFLEIKALKSKQPLPSKSSLLSLCPFLDGFGVLRVGGRLQNTSCLSYSQMHPIILPSNHQVSTNLIHVAHNATLHGANTLTAFYLRNKFHIIRCNERIKYIIRRCPTCIRFSRNTHEQLMGSLPKDRVNINRPFSSSGVDFAGPFTLKAYKGRCKKMLKCWVSLFICFTTKAIHLELVTDLTAVAFLAAFKRFTNRRGLCKNLYSDRGTNFVKGDKLLAEEIDKAKTSWKSELEVDFTSMGTSWHFNPPGAPHFGGLWEAGVKSMKSHLNKTLKTSLLTFEEFDTILIQIEGILNSRPLCPLTNDPNNFVFLTPAHFLIGESIIAPPERAFDCSTDSKNPIDRWQYIQKLRQLFWISWKKDYLHSLNTRSKWRKHGVEFEKGNLVLLMDENTPPTNWPTAIILEIHPGKDDKTRVVTLKTQKGQIFKRPTSKLRLIPTQENEHLIPLENESSH